MAITLKISSSYEAEMAKDLDLALQEYLFGSIDAHGNAHDHRSAILRRAGAANPSVKRIVSRADDIVCEAWDQGLYRLARKAIDIIIEADALMDPDHG